MCGVFSVPLRVVRDRYLGICIDIVHFQNCQLICPGHGMMGLNNVTSKTMKTHIYQCLLIDPEDGVRTIDIPFHLILRYYV